MVTALVHVRIWTWHADITLSFLNVEPGPSAGSWTVTALVHVGIWTWHADITLNFLNVEPGPSAGMHVGFWTCHSHKT